MRVLVVTTWYPSVARPESGIFVARDVALLARHHEVEVIHMVNKRIQAHPSIEEIDGIRVHRFPISVSNPISLVRAGLMVRATLPSFDVLHTMAFSALMPFFVLRVTAPWVHTEHWSGLVAPHTVPFSVRASLPLTRGLLKRPDVVVAVSAFLAQEIEKHRSSTVVVVPNAVSVGATPVPRRRPGQTLRLLGVGGLISRKGPAIAVDAVAELTKRGVNVELTWLGEGPERPRLETQCREKNVDNRVTFAGRADFVGVAEALNACDVFVLPTEFETFGVALAEALASGRPVVTSGQGGHRDFVHPPDGLVVEHRDGVSIANGIEAVVAANHGRGARQIAKAIRARFSDDARAGAYFEAYESAQRRKLS